MVFVVGKSKGNKQVNKNAAKKKVQILTRKREWQKLGVNLAVVYQEAKAEDKRIDYSFTEPINMLPRTINDNSRLNCRSQDLSTIVTVNVVPMIQVL
jgi:beta-lactamase superfamily II metal-dependent hydrolase